MISKRIFYVWGCNDQKSTLTDVCIENWRMMMPDYEIIEINEKAKDWFDFDYEYNNNLWFKTVYDLKMWAYVADYMRVKVIYDHGGIYLDTDVTVYKSFDEMLKHKMFIGNCKNNIPELAMIAAQKGNRYLGEMVDFYKDDIWKNSAYMITSIFKDVMNKHGIFTQTDKIYENDEITIYTPEYFYPYHHGEQFSHSLITPNTYIVHWGNGSWSSKKNLYFLSNKHRVALSALLKQLEFIEKNDKDANMKIKIG